MAMLHAQISNPDLDLPRSIDCMIESLVMRESSPEIAPHRVKLAPRWTSPFIHSISQEGLAPAVVAALSVQNASCRFRTPSHLFLFHHAGRRDRAEEDR